MKWAAGGAGLRRALVGPPGGMAAVSEDEYVSGAERWREHQVAGDAVLEPVPPLHAVRTGGVAVYGKARAVCGASVEVVQPMAWPPSTDDCWECTRLTRS